MKFPTWHRRWKPWGIRFHERRLKVAIEIQKKDWGVIHPMDLEDGQIAQIIEWTYYHSRDKGMLSGQLVQRVGGDLFTLGHGEERVIRAFFAGPNLPGPDQLSTVLVVPEGATFKVVHNTKDHVKGRNDLDRVTL